MEILKLNSNEWRHNDVIVKKWKIWYLTLTFIKFDPDNKEILNLERW